MKKSFLVVFFLLMTSFAFGQLIDMEAARAEESFRNGVSAFHNGFLNKAYIDFEKALSLKPEEKIYSYWLAETYYRNGYNSMATKIWLQLIEQGFETSFLSNRVEQVRRMSMPKVSFLDVDYVLSHEIDGNINGIDYFAGPIAISPDSLGGFYITSYMTGEILQINANGRFLQHNKNRLMPYNRIFDLIYSEDGRFFASEMGNDRIFEYDSLSFSPKDSFGESGRGEGQFNGPQYIAQDDSGYLYITDVGNQRICKYTQSGEFVLAFGQENFLFPGLRLPTGVATLGETLLVADKRDKVLYFFDLSGNYLGEAGRGKFHSPEGITPISSKEVLVADGGRLVLFDFELESIYELSDFNGRAQHLIKAGLDLNSNIICSDFKQNKIFYLTDRSLIYSGLYLQVEYVDNSQYPTVYIDITVKDSLGRPFSGLDQSNFLLSEGGQRIDDLDLVYSDVSSQEVSVALLMDRSSAVLNSQNQIENVIQAFFSDLKKGDYFALITEDQQPLLLDDIHFRSKADLSLVESFLESVFDKSILSDENGLFDLGVHESINRLLNYQGKKAVVYLTDGELDEEDFNEYNLTKIENYLINNNMAFYFVQMVPEMGSGLKDLEYLAERSGGKGFSIFSPTGVSDLISDIRKTQNGSYVLKYKSPSNDGYGRNYLEFSLEVNHFNRTGRVLWGYYAPLDFTG